jgi:Fe-S cluster assembly protein SufD
MKSERTISPLEKILLQYAEKNTVSQTEEKSGRVPEIKQKALELFRKSGLPDKKLEKWRNTDMSDWYQKTFNPETGPEVFTKEVNDIFECTVQGFDSNVVSVLNGHYYSPETLSLQKLENGVIIGSLAKAKIQYPEYFEKYYGEIAETATNGLTAINTAIAEDGVFIYIPDNVVVEKPVQLIKLVNKRGLMLNTRNLIILGKNSSFTFLHCDDSINHDDSFINTLTEIHIGENATLDLYKLQNINDETALINNSFFNMERDSRLKVNVLSFNGGLIRNELHVNLNGTGADARLNGLYLMDKKQHIDNQVYVNHNAPHCNSSELFKGILDNQARGVFNGYIYVVRDAQKTNAFQRNNNILMTSSTKINTMPFLEIYADDVQCSHGATVGQIDNEALFYLMQRGIPFDDARMLLMFAFAAEITDNIKIETLKTNIDDMVKKRLRGELSICDRCVLHCTVPDKPIEFDIDLSKI